MTAPYPPNTALGRFGIAPIVDGPDPFVSSMPLAGLVNPLTGAPTIHGRMMVGALPCPVP